MTLSNFMLPKSDRENPKASKQVQIGQFNTNKQMFIERFFIFERNKMIILTPLKHKKMLRKIVCIFALVFLFPFCISAQAPFRLVYSSPIHASANHHPLSQIVFKTDTDIGAEDRHKLSVEVKGDQGRLIPGETVFCSDRRTLTFKAAEPFPTSAHISASLLYVTDNLNKPPVIIQEIAFSIRDSSLPFYAGNFNPTDDNRPVEFLPITNKHSSTSRSNYNELPPDFPQLNIHISNHPKEGYYFMAGLPIGLNPRIYMTIIDTSGLPVFYQKLPNRSFDFRLQENGMLSYYSGIESKFRVLDSAYQITNLLGAANGYVTDSHELILKDDGSYWILAIDVQQVDMSQIVPGGNPNANVAGNVIQHIDQSGHVLFQWRSWDHMEITDCDTRFVNLTASYIDYVHANAISFDFDGHILLSSRHLNEITKINSTSGAIIWRWGGNMNQFSFQPGDEGFYGQHSIRYNNLNDTYTLFDNGNWHTPAHSRGMEYTLNQIDKSATLTHIFDSEPLIFSEAMGHLQRLDDGGTIVGWAGNLDFYVFTEYDASGNKVFEIISPDTAMVSYRVFKFDWKTNLFVFTADSLDFGEIETGDSAFLDLTIRNNMNSPLEINGYHISETVFSIATELPISIAPQSTQNLSLRFKPAAIEPYMGVLSVFHSTDTSRVAQQIKLTGGGLMASDQELASRSSATLLIFPNPSTKYTSISSPSGALLDHIQIYEISGKQVLNATYDRSPLLFIDTASLESGFYSVVVQSGNKKFFGKLLVR